LRRWFPGKAELVGSRIRVLFVSFLRWGWMGWFQGARNADSQP
jgi:hypothetical protein